MSYRKTTNLLVGSSSLLRAAAGMSEPAQNRVACWSVEEHLA
jgi:hypothetical protein